MFIVALLLAVHCYSPSDEEIEDLIKSLTLAEKVGQMTQLAIDDFIANDKVKDDYATRVINGLKIGSVLNTYDGAPHTNAVWASIQRSLDSYAQKNTHKIPILYGLDSIHGATYVINATFFPHEIGVAATFNRTVAELSAKISAYETRSASVPWTFSPVLDLGLDPRWPRQYEDFGEDPYLGAEMGAAMVRGYQGNDTSKIDIYHVAACAKHYLGYGNPVNGHDRTPAIIPDNYLREYHLPAFQAAVEAGVLTVMVNSGLINEVPVHSSKYLLTDLLKTELGFTGLVVTDWGDIESLHSRDRIAESSREAIQIAINAGIDMAMVPYSLNFVNDLVELVNQGKVSIDRINDAVRRILRVKAKLGLFQNPTTKPETYTDFASAASARIAYEAAAQSITLLKNDQSILPLKTGTRVLVTGPNANTMRGLNGGWTYSWQGEVASRYTSQYNTILKAIRHVNGESNVVFSAGVEFSSISWALDTDVGIQAAATAAANVDAVILCLGENSYSEGSGNLADITISDNQLKLAQALIQTGKPIILVLNEGRPRIISKIVGSVKAVIQLYLPGNYGGDALADILFGKVNPSGRLPYNYPRYVSSIVNYWHKYSEQTSPGTGVANDYNPQWEFGTGLSYTTFQYSALTLSKTTMTSADTITVSVTVKNTGTRAGKEAVLLYTSDLYASVAPDTKRLRKFTKIELAPGASQVVQFSLTPKDLSFIGENNKRITERGDFKIQVGSLSQNLRFQ